MYKHIIILTEEYEITALLINMIIIGTITIKSAITAIIFSIHDYGLQNAGHGAPPPAPPSPGVPSFSPEALLIALN